MTIIFTKTVGNNNAVGLYLPPRVHEFTYLFRVNKIVQHVCVRLCVHVRLKLCLLVFE